MSDKLASCIESDGTVLGTHAYIQRNIKYVMFYYEGKTLSNNLIGTRKGPAVVLVGCMKVHNHESSQEDWKNHM
jgi:hypothetical protein